MISFSNRFKSVPCTKILILSVLFAAISEPLLRMWLHLETLVGQSPSSILSYLLDIHLIPAFLLFALGILLWTILFTTGQQLGDFIYRWRYLISTIILVLCVILDINGSSIHMWSDYLNSSSNGQILGAARALRSDEWALNTPFAISQCSNITGNAFSYYNNIVRGTSTDMFIVYGQPVLDFAELFRPFHWGYLLFGASRGLSFFWCARQIALILVSFELGMLLTKKARLLSFLFSIALSFSSFVQWWFAINGLVEMLIFGFLAILMIYKYMHTKRYRTRFICTLVLIECSCAFVLTFYPAWMVPIGYVLAGIALWVIIVSWKTFCFKKQDLLLLAMFLLLTTGSLSYIIFYRSWDTIQLTLNTAYPGSRIALDPLDLSFFGSSVGNFFTAFWDMNLPVNSVENATLLSFMPLGTILSIFFMFSQKKADSLSIILLGLSALFFCYVFIGFNVLAANITLLKFSTPNRVLPILHLTQFLLLYRSLALLEKPLHIRSVLIIGIVSWLCILFPSLSYCSDYLGRFSFILGAGAMLLLILLFLMYRRKHSWKLYVFFFSLGIFFSGILVNPVQQGVGELTNSAEYKMVESIVSQDDSGLWIVENGGYPMINLPIAAGASTINSTNVYPVLERWETFDPDGTSTEIYNRYAHITINLTHDTTHFDALTSLDGFTININPSDLQSLDVKYIVTFRDLTEFNSESVQFNKIEGNNNIYIYQVSYSGI